MLESQSLRLPDEWGREVAAKVARAIRGACGREADKNADVSDQIDDACDAAVTATMQVLAEEFNGRDPIYDATDLAEARAEGKRQALEEAAAKAEGQLTYWRERMRAEKCLEDGVSEDGAAYTPIGDVAAWEGGYCNGRMGEAEWWIGTLRSLATAPAETGESR